MSCKYYMFKDNDYYCIKKKEWVDSDWYREYCRDYNYDECPVYDNEGSSGGCYLTTACVEAMGLDDNCYELETLRNYRDTWLKKSDEGIRIIREYYNIAPQIVDAINESDRKKEVYKQIYEQMVLPCVCLIENHSYEEAMHLYYEMTRRLQKQYAL